MVHIEPLRHGRHLVLRRTALAERRRARALPGALVERLIGDAAAESYDALGISGSAAGWWPGLFDALFRARSLGLATALATDPIALTARRLGKLTGALDALAVGLDGMPATHDGIRGRPGAFAAMAARLPLLRAAGIPFGFVLNLTRVNLDELFWVAHFARDEGAKLLQIRPLDGEPAMRRRREIGVGAAYLAAMRHNGRRADGTTIRLDLARRNAVRGGVARGRSGAPPDLGEGPLADLVETLAVEADGVVVPLEHGFPRRHALGNLRCARLPVLARRWRSCGGWTGFRTHCEASLRAAGANRASAPAFNWFAAVSARLGPPVALAVD